MSRIMEDDVLTPVRQGGVDGRPFWNTYARQFIYAPALEFPSVVGAVSYRYQAEDRYGKVHSFVADGSCAVLAPIWKELPTGPVYLTVEALDASGKVLSQAGFRVFYKEASFTDSYPRKRRSYAEAAQMTYDYLFNMKEIQELATGKPDLEFELFCYPSKMHSSIITGMINYGELCPDKKEQAMAIAVGAAKYLIETAVPADKPLAGLPLTYIGDKLTAKKFGDAIMMLYPAVTGNAMLKLHEATNDAQYLEFARGIGDKYLELQQPNGSWFLNLTIEDGKPKDPNFCVPTTIMEFLEKLSEAAKSDKYAIAARKGLPWLRKKFETFDWEGQFEDVEAQYTPYLNMTFHNATAMFLYLCPRDPANRNLTAEAREVQRYSEDQFVVWEQPGWAGSGNTWSWRTREEFQNRDWGWYRRFHVPSVLEQYRCYVPIDGASSKMIRYYLMMYDLEKKPLDLAKARALGDSLTNIQEHNGRIPTWGDYDRPVKEDWINCMMGSANALKTLSMYDDIHLAK